MDRDKDARLTYDEFVEGSKQDPTIVQVCLPRARNVIFRIECYHRRYRYMTDSYDLALLLSEFSIAGE